MGERLQLDREPRNNTLAQRSWLYSDDPAVMIKIKGRPPAPVITDLSLALPGDREETAEAKVNVSYGRRYVFTGDILSKTGSRRAGVFLDEKNVL